MKRTGRNKVKTYNLSIPAALLDLAYRSSFFRSKTLPTVKRLPDSEGNILSKFGLDEPRSQAIAVSIRQIHSKCTVNGYEYNIVDCGGEGNCYFLAVAASLTAILPTNTLDHKSLRKGVSRWYIDYGQQHEAFINAKPCDVILDNPDLPARDVFRRYSWVNWGQHIGKDGVWGGASEIMAVNMILPDGYKLNIVESASGVIYGQEHNKQDDSIVFVFHRGFHYYALIRVP